MTIFVCIILVVGFELNSLLQTVRIPQAKHDKFSVLVHEFKQSPQRECKTLERLRGKAISWLLVLTNSKLFIREMNACIAKATAEEWTYFPDGYLENTGLFREFDFWLNLTPADLVRPWHEPHHGLIERPIYEKKRTSVLYTDASSYKLGSCLLYKGRRVYRSFGLTEAEYNTPIHIKEGLAVYRCVQAYRPELTSRRIKLMCDNMSVVSAWNGDGCKDLRLSRIIIDLYLLLKDMNCTLVMEWVSTVDQLGDAPSREISPHDDAVLRPHLVALVHTFFQPNVDCFAEKHNSLCGRYISRYEEKDQFWIDALSYELQDGDVPYIFSPKALVGASLKVLATNAKKCVFVYHVHVNHDPHFGACERHFEYRVTIGGTGNPSCLTVSNKSKHSHPERDGYRLYKEPVISYLYLKGYPRSIVEQFAAHARYYAAFKASGVGTVTKL